MRKIDEGEPVVTEWVWGVQTERGTQSEEIGIDMDEGRRQKQRFLNVTHYNEAM